MRNKPGALHELLVPFHNNGIDLTRIEPPVAQRAMDYGSSSISSATIKTADQDVLEKIARKPSP
ncbi:hypothetical protein [Pseudomonas aeruginosa]|uniref:hypothetical protein n=1 Tax=Pseudomonas aeruginosa TaxID=287 RepID=UPI001CEDC981|nr:hypothetical protein [Pseudomonas aeruginosa]